MKLGEKLQQLRRQSGLSQEQLAAQLTVSRQAVSKWELDETMPDTENVVQLSRIFGVSCDYLLREEVDERGAPVQPAAPRETHLNGAGWIHNATVLALALCATGLVAAYLFYIVLRGYRIMAAGFAVQVLGLALFELATPRMGSGRCAARLNCYTIACWLVLPVPVFWGLTWVFDFLMPWYGTVWQSLICYFSVYLLLCAAITAALSILRRRMAAKN